jgi:hypothetical protein
LPKFLGFFAMVGLLVMGLVACGDEKTPTPPPSPSIAVTPQLTSAPAQVSAPAATVTPSIDPKVFLGKDGICATLVAVPLAGLKEAQNRFGLEKALAGQQPAMKNYKSDARPFGATLNCTGGRLAWSLNWTSDTAKLSWIFTSYAEDTPAAIETRLKQGLASYPETNSAELFNVEPSTVISLDKIAEALAQKGFKSDSKILSLSLVVIPAQSRFQVILDQANPQSEINLDATTGKIIE